MENKVEEEKIIDTSVPDKKLKEKILKERKIVSFAGLVLVILYLALGIACIFLGGFSFHTLYATWSEGPWKAVAPCAMAVSTVVIFVGIFGLFVFFTENDSYIIYYIAIAIVSLLFSWAISIFAIIGGKISYKVDGFLGCNTKSTGIMKMWDNVDEYLKYADSLLCSKQCSCPFAKAVKEEYENDPFAYDTYKTWEKHENNTMDSFILSDCKSGLEERFRFNFEDCSKFVKNELLDRYIENSNSTHHWIKPAKFAKYWRRLEKKFNCTGWCKTHYTDPYTNQEKGMFKFIFSDINMGIPKYPGCLSRVIQWLPKILLAFGGCLNISAFFQTVAFALAIKRLNNLYEYPGLEDKKKGE